MTESPFKYVEAAVTLAEVPKEISLTISVSNCRFRCCGCHSPYLQKDIGRPLLPDLDAPHWPLCRADHLRLPDG